MPGFTLLALPSSKKAFRWFRFERIFRYVSASDEAGLTQIINLDIRRKMLDLHLSDAIDVGVTRP